MKYLNIKKALTAWQNLQPLSEKDKERLSRRFTVDFNYNSNHIEGNTLTYGQTEILLLFGKVIGEADVRDVQEMTASNIGLRMMTEEAALIRDGAETIWDYLWQTERMPLTLLPGIVLV